MNDFPSVSAARKVHMRIKRAVHAATPEMAPNQRPDISTTEQRLHSSLADFVFIPTHKIVKTLSLYYFPTFVKFSRNFIMWLFVRPPQWYSRIFVISARNDNITSDLVGPSAVRLPKFLCFKGFSRFLAMRYFNLCSM